ncbi:hypothetical protein [Pseudomonas sp. GL-RE-29]|nr:hypothetical protein [Pseudomonas sp. GL-RE-29]
MIDFSTAFFPGRNLRAIAVTDRLAFVGEKPRRPLDDINSIDHAL